ncbi:MAG: methyltransferase [Acidibacillus sp.]|nr:methyltransferase [Acidibacillus sp.]
MSDHYYSSKPSSLSERSEIHAVLRGLSFKFVTDRGVFSRSEVDFGSALLAESAFISPGDRLLDLGCGYGVVGIALANSVKDVELWSVDINERAVELCRMNAARVGIDAHVLESDGVAKIPSEIAFNCVVLNPPIRAGKSTVWRLYAEAESVLLPHGELYVVIQKKQGARSSAEYLRTLFHTVEVIANKSGYQVIQCVKMAT